MSESLQHLVFDLDSEPRAIVQLNEAIPQHPIVAHLAAGGIGLTKCAFWETSLYVTEDESASVWRLDLGMAGLLLFDQR